MTFTDIPVPEVYKESADFRFFLRWFELCLGKLQYQTDNLIDLLDPLRCPKELLWMLADTCGYKYDERASVAFNRLVILYFATLIMYRGSHTGITFGAQVNLAQFNLQKYAEENPILEDRLEDTSLPTNSASVTAHPELGYIDLVYYSEKIPTDICLEYVRPLGMYCFTHAGVSVNARTKITVDARLTNMNDTNVRPGPSFVAHYRRSDYASLQKFENDDIERPELRRAVYYRNMDNEEAPSAFINPGYRSLYSLQLCNNEHIVKALLPSLEEYDPIFSLGHEPLDVGVMLPDNYLKNKEKYPFNLRVDRDLEESFTPSVYTVEKAESVITPRPAVNPVMFAFGDAIMLNDENTAYTKVNRDTGEISVIRLSEHRSTVPAPVLISATVDGTNVTVSYMIPSAGESYAAIRLAVKKGSMPTSFEDADMNLTIPEPTTTDRTGSTLIPDLDSNSQYYFVLYTETVSGIWTSSSAISCTTQEPVLSMIDSFVLGDIDWDGSEMAFIWSGQNNKLTAQISSSSIVFKMYTGSTEIYSWTSFIGSTISDTSHINISFLKDDTNQIAKPSFIYETSENIYSYNQESPTNAEMSAIWQWLQGDNNR